MIWILIGIFAVAQLISTIIIISLRRKVKRAEQKEIYYKSRVSAPALHSDNASNNDILPKNEAKPLVSVPDVEAYLTQSRNSAMAARIETHKEDTTIPQQTHVAPQNTISAEQAYVAPQNMISAEQAQVMPQQKVYLQDKAVSQNTETRGNLYTQEAIQAIPMIERNNIPSNTLQTAPEQLYNTTQATQTHAQTQQNSPENNNYSRGIEINNPSPVLAKKRHLLYQLINERAELEQPFKNQNQIKSFLKEFNEAYPGYLSSLRHQYKELTGSDELVLALMVNELSIQQICCLLESKPRTIWSRRLRIKNHLGLTNEDNIDEWVQNSVRA